MQAHFVTFYSPGTFVAETTTKPIDSWDVNAAKEMSRHVIERYQARPYAFQFSTRERGDADLDSRVVATSGMYYLGGIVETLEEVKARGDERDRILIANMIGNGWKRIVRTAGEWSWSQPLRDEDTVLVMENVA